MSINSLPDKLISSSFNSLDNKDLSQAAQVCKKWNSATKLPHTYNNYGQYHKFATLLRNPTVIPLDASEKFPTLAPLSNDKMTYLGNENTFTCVEIENPSKEYFSIREYDYLGTFNGSAYFFGKIKNSSSSESVLITILNLENCTIKEVFYSSIRASIDPFLTKPTPSHRKRGGIRICYPINETKILIVFPQPPDYLALTYDLTNDTVIKVKKVQETTFRVGNFLYTGANTEALSILKCDEQLTECTATDRLSTLPLAISDNRLFALMRKRINPRGHYSEYACFSQNDDGSLKEDWRYKNYSVRSAYFSGSYLAIYESEGNDIIKIFHAESGKQIFTTSRPKERPVAQIRFKDNIFILNNLAWYFFSENKPPRKLPPPNQGHYIAGFTDNRCITIDALAHVIQQTQPQLASTPAPSQPQLAPSPAQSLPSLPEPLPQDTPSQPAPTPIQEPPQLVPSPALSLPSLTQSLPQDTPPQLAPTPIQEPLLPQPKNISPLQPKVRKITVRRSGCSKISHLFRLLLKRICAIAKKILFCKHQ